MSAIHQEIDFDAQAFQVYTALLNAEQFAQFTQAEAEIDAAEGGQFNCFGSFITGRIVELIPSQRIVQAWRVFNWPEGVYSIVRFELSEADGKARLVMDQSGVPEDAVEHVDQGWAHKYWSPLKSFLSA